MITLETLPQATKQEVFDQVARHLLSQKVASRHPTRFIKESDGEGICMYRSPAGLKCAAGCLIGDDEYDEHFENHTWISLVVDKKVPSNHLHLISRLQTIHDTTDPSIWKDGLEKLAIANKLNTNVLEEN